MLDGGAVSSGVSGFVYGVRFGVAIITTGARDGG